MDRYGTYSLVYLPASAQARGPVGQQTRRLDVDRALRDLPLDPLEVGDRLAERGALLDVLGGVHERALGQADAARGHDRAHGVEAEHGQAEAADLADDVLGRDVDVGQDQLAGVDAAHAHLVVGAAHVDAVPGALDDEGGDGVVRPARRVARLGEDGVPVRLLDARHPALGAVEDPAARHRRRARRGSACPSRRCRPGARTARRRPAATRRRSRAGSCFFCSSVPAIITGPVGRRVSSSISAAVLEYLATSSMAMARPRIPAPEPPYSGGMHRPSRPASRKASKRSAG